MALGFLIPLLILIIIFLPVFLKIVNQYERGVKFTFGRYSGLMQPGLRILIPVIQTWERIDMRTRVIDVPDQDCISGDNVSVQVNAVLYYRVIDASKAFIKVQHFEDAISQLSQTTMRDVVGEVSLDELLSKRDAISNRIQHIVDKATDPWGIKILSVDLKHIELPPQLTRTMAKEAEAERERRAVILKAEGEFLASKNLTHAATILGSAPGAMHLRTLQSLNDMSSDQTNHIVFAVPLDVLQALEKVKRR